ncbi:MAG: hypothetical protein K2X06_12300 [Burkholderiales bacterium]|nr:hypothetical protein [Burkholderiales bacterium]
MSLAMRLARVDFPAPILPQKNTSTGFSFIAEMPIKGLSHAVQKDGGLILMVVADADRAYRALTFC